MNAVSQVVYPELQRKRMDRARHRKLRHAAVRALQRHVQPFGSMLTRSGATLRLRVQGADITVRRPYARVRKF
jgi:hypothetical protein